MASSMAGRPPMTEPIERNTDSAERSLSSEVMTCAIEPYGMLIQVYSMPNSTYVTAAQT